MKKSLALLLNLRDECSLSIDGGWQHLGGVMAKKITWSCSECSHRDVYPGSDDVTLEWLQSSEITTNTMCSICGAPCAPIKVEAIGDDRD